jgi:chemotaxis regulatin CheY-phosphate phosphatase CheZ
MSLPIGRRRPMPQEESTVSDLSAGHEALEQLNERVRRLGARLADQSLDGRGRPGQVGSAADEVLNSVDAAQPVYEAAAAEAEALSLRLAGLADHPELGVGEARAALAEAAAALQHQGGVLRSQCRMPTGTLPAAKRF